MAVHERTVLVVTYLALKECPHEQSANIHAEAAESLATVGSDSIVALTAGCCNPVHGFVDDGIEHTISPLPIIGAVEVILMPHLEPTGLRFELTPRK
jgi:hypothetical protein